MARLNPLGKCLYSFFPGHFCIPSINYFTFKNWWSLIKNLFSITTAKLLLGRHCIRLLALARWSRWQWCRLEYFRQLVKTLIVRRFTPAGHMATFFLELTRSRWQANGLDEFWQFYFSFQSHPIGLTLYFPYFICSKWSCPLNWSIQYRSFRICYFNRNVP